MKFLELQTTSYSHDKRTDNRQPTSLAYDPYISHPELSMKKTALILLLTFALSALAFAGDTYLPGKIAKWENGSYPDGKKMKTWVVYSLQTDSTSYQIAHKGENKPQMQ